MEDEGFSLHNGLVPTSTLASGATDLSKGVYDTPVYGALSETTSEFRLVVLQPCSGDSDRIICHLVKSKLEESNEPQKEFEALSYTWGKPEVGMKDIYINGAPLKVRINLYWALHHLRHPDRERTLWLDALSINHHDIRERNSQVSKMGMVFSQAVGVIVWLGLEDEDSIRAFEELETWDE